MAHFSYLQPEATYALTARQGTLMKPLSRMSLITLLLLLPTTAFASDPPIFQRTITVQGEGSATTTPDIAHIDLAVVSQNADLVHALNQNIRQSNHLFDTLRLHSVAERDTLTIGFHVNQINPSQRQRLAGQHPYFEITNNLRITTRHLDRLGILLTAALKHANRVGQLTFSHSQNPALMQQARNEAMIDAKTRARHYAAQANTTLGPVISIVEGRINQRRQPVTFQARNEQAMSLASAPPIPIAGGELTYHAAVTVVYAINPTTPDGLQHTTE